MPKPYRGIPKPKQTGRIARQLKREWRREHPTPELVPNQTVLHIDRARIALPVEIEPGSLAYRAANKYFDERLTMTAAKVEQLGAGTPSAATDMTVFEALVPDKDTAPIQDICEVSRGIAAAKIALGHTMLHQ